MFHNTANGANTSALIYSISETAKLNNLRPYNYFKYILTELPKHCDEKRKYRTCRSGLHNALVRTTSRGMQETTPLMIKAALTLVSGRCFDVYLLYEYPTKKCILFDWAECYCVGIFTI